MEDSVTYREDDAIQRHLDRLLKARASPKTICPSEVARALSGEELNVLEVKEWKDTMPMIRERVWAMRGEGLVEVLQKGEVLGEEVEVKYVKGPIRVRLKGKEQM